MVVSLHRGTTFWVMRSQATDKEHPAQAVMQEATARTLVEMLFMSETEAKGALKKAGIYATKDDDSGKALHGALHRHGRRPARRVLSQAARCQDTPVQTSLHVRHVCAARRVSSRLLRCRSAA